MTVYEYIRARWPNHCQRIIEAAYEQDRRGAEYDLTHELNKSWVKAGVLCCLFVWANTSEGHEYWKALAEGGEEVRL